MKNIYVKYLVEVKYPWWFLGSFLKSPCQRSMVELICENTQRQPHKMVKHTQKVRRLLPANCLSVFDHFVGLELKVLTGL